MGLSGRAIDCRLIGLRVNSIEVEYLPSKQMARVRFPSVNVVLIRNNDNTGSESISTKDESCPSSSINDESGESLVDTTLSMLKMKGKIPA
ncbi:hypothetical protein H8356DRAFT_1329554 [Neocallimastix lanati (nom. inval.)]|nr:hypothetical protein H8356DRAFT_1329554 [Neocallimastix sp. JGI-2020a]